MVSRIVVGCTVHDDAAQRCHVVGVAAVALVFISWTVVLSKVDLSAAMPVTSLSYLMVALIAVVCLHERIPVLEWCGIFLIMVGVAIVSWEPGEKKGPAP